MAGLEKFREPLQIQAWYLKPLNIDGHLKII